MLDHNTTLDLIERAKKDDQQAKTELIEHNSPLIKSIIRRYKNKGIEYDDLYQLGCMGIIKAINNFDPKFGVKFSTYAVPMIAGEVKRFLRDDGSIKVSRMIKTQASKINKFIEIYKSEHGESPKLELLSEEFKIDPQEIVFILDSGKIPISIYDKNDESDDRGQSLLDKLSGVDTSEHILDGIIIKDILNSLEERERKIILMRYYRDYTQSQIAAILGISQVQVSRLENKILSNIKAKFAGQ